MSIKAGRTAGKRRQTGQAAEKETHTAIRPALSGRSFRMRRKKRLHLRQIRNAVPTAGSAAADCRRSTGKSNSDGERHFMQEAVKKSAMKHVSGPGCIHGLDGKRRKMTQHSIHKSQTAMLARRRNQHLGMNLPENFQQSLAVAP